MKARQILAAAALAATFFGVASCAEDSAEEREAPASEQGEEGEAEYED